MTFDRLVVCTAAILLSCAASEAAFAEEPAVTADTASPQSAVTPAASATAFEASSPIEENELGSVTGREDSGLMIASATQRNTVANNSVSGTSVTGAIRIDGNAFQNVQGLAVISANSGNNVAINSAMNVTVNMAPR